MWHEKDADSSGRYILRWLPLCLTPLIPVVLGFQLRPEMVGTLWFDATHRKLLLDASCLSVAATLPLLVDLHLDFRVTFGSIFWQRFIMVAATMVVNISILLMNYLDVEEGRFQGTVMSLFLLRDAVTCAALLSSIRLNGNFWVADLYMLFHLLVILQMMFVWFCPGPAEMHLWQNCLDSIAVALRVALAATCILEIRTVESNSKNHLRAKIMLTISALLMPALGPLFLTSPGFPVATVCSYTHVFMTVASFCMSKTWKQNDHVHVKDLLNAKREFVRYIAHEMRTPLNVAVIGLELAENQCSRPSVKIASLQQILSESHASIEEVANMLNEFLLFDKVESGTLSLEKEEFLVLPVLESVYKSFFLQAQDKSLQYSLSADSSLQSVALRADRKKITQAMRNYISNALKFTPAAGSVTISARACPADGTQEGVYTFHFEVVDTGAGIAASNLPRVFKEVVQFEAARLQNGGGSGLGLTITRAIVEAHGGAVGVRSVYGRGSTFWLDLEAHTALSTVAPMLRTMSSDLTVGPQYEGCSSDLSTPACTPVEHPAGMSKPPLDLASPPMLPAASTPPPTSLSTFEKLGVALIVDDSKINLKMMSRICAPFVQEIVTATNGVEGAEIVEASLRGQDRRRIDVVLTDYHMPVMDGIEMTARIRAAGYSGFIALVTGDDGVVMSNFHASGGNMILSKPVTVTAITRTFVEAHRTLQI